MAAPSFAAGAYAATQRLGTGAGLSIGKPEAAGGGGAFSQLLQNALTTTSSTAKTADAQTMAAAGGNADLVQVVSAVAESEAAIETLVAVRDRVIAAYEEIMRMSI